MGAIGIPIKLLHEAAGHTVTIELNTGELYRGLLSNVEDNMNCQLDGVTATGRDGRQTRLEHCFLRGSKIRFLIIPDILKNAAMFQKMDASKMAQRGRGMGYGIVSRGGRGRGRGVRGGGGGRGRGRGGGGDRDRDRDRPR